MTDQLPATIPTGALTAATDPPIFRMITSCKG